MTISEHQQNGESTLWQMLTHWQQPLPMHSPSAVITKR